jgi:hypothetical protein
MSFYRNVGWSNDEAAFLSAVHQLRDVMSTVAQTHGSSGQFRVSHAQKSLALLLKYYWCAGEAIAPPLFCPLDRRVLWKAGVLENWTQLDDMKEYVGWLRKTREGRKCSGLPVPRRVGTSHLLASAERRLEVLDRRSSPRTEADEAVNRIGAWPRPGPVHAD